MKEPRHLEQVRNTTTFHLRLAGRGAMVGRRTIWTNRWNNPRLYNPKWKPFYYRIPDEGDVLLYRIFYSKARYIRPQYRGMIERSILERRGFETVMQISRTKVSGYRPVIARLRARSAKQEDFPDYSNC